MNMQVVYTLINECHDCYKCVRECPVKAIKIENGHASVLPDKCVACGACVRACPSRAKRVRSDVEKVKNILLSGRKTYVSLAPSWRASFDCDAGQIVAFLKRLGFAGVSETAVGAEQVSMATAALLNKADKGLFISSACPVSVDYIRAKKPEFAPHIVPVASPAQTHARMLKDYFANEDVAVVFIGPCIGKKNESDAHPDLIDAALTFEEIELWKNDERIDINAFAGATETFSAFSAHEGTLYPLAGGMNETVKKVGVSPNVQLLTIDSLAALDGALAALPDFNQDGRVVFLEVLACAGGCAAGPCLNPKKTLLQGASDIMAHTKIRPVVPTKPDVVVPMTFPARADEKALPTFEEIEGALKRIGKHSPKDELNCGGCGYATCRGLAAALLTGMAEPSMCVSYMRKIAMRKAAAMLRCMPSAAVMVDSGMKIVEANDAFLRLFAADEYDVLSTLPEGLTGALLEKVADFTPVFKTAFKTGKDVHKERFSLNGRLYDITAFTIEKNELAGAVISDVTLTETTREQIAAKAREVISKNITTVQEIACLLGEHMVETETLLSSIADDYSAKKDEK